VGKKKILKGKNKPKQQQKTHPNRTRKITTLQDILHFTVFSFFKREIPVSSQNPHLFQKLELHV